ncbi:MAG: endo-1,4-beta-xylanase [Reyranellaceae bacterium]
MSYRATRRQVVSSAIASTISGAGLAADCARAAEDSLSTRFARRKLYFGAAVRVEEVVREPDFRDVLLRECDYLTPEVALKWAAVESSPGAFDFASMDALTSFALANKKQLHGHTLVWHKSVPSWAASPLREKDGWQLMKRYFEAALLRYGHAIAQWDVVNEPIETGYRMDGLRSSPFLQAFGADYIARALWEARRLASQANLMINEFGLEYDSRLEQDRRYHFLKLLERLKGAGVPLDGVGLQAHLDLSKGALSTDALRRLLKEIADLGLFIVVSELDVKEFDYILPVEQRDARVADEVRRYLEVVMAEPAVRGLSTWGLSDRHSWLQVTPEDLARYPGAWKDGSNPGVNRGLPFDTSMKPKPMYRAIAEAGDPRR